MVSEVENMLEELENLFNLYKNDDNCKCQYKNVGKVENKNVGLM